MTEEDPCGALSLCCLLAHEDELFRLSVSATADKTEAACAILPEGFAAVAAAVFKSPEAEIKRVPWDFSIVLCADELIRALNLKFRNIDAPTDILSFELGGEYEEGGKTFFCAGELVISLDSLASNCAEFGVSENEELKRLVIHGILHLNGMDHSGSSLEQKMLKIQESILKALDGVFLLKGE